MSTDAHETAPRFRRAAAHQATNADRLARVTSDPERFVQLFREFAADAVREESPEQVVELARVGEKIGAEEYRYVVNKHGAELLLAASSVQDAARESEWTTWVDTVIDLLIPVLDAQPHEPELLNLLGVAVYELGHVSLARHVFEAVRTMEPNHAQARANLRGCKERMKLGRGVEAVSADQTPYFERHRSRIKPISQRATKLVDQTISLCMIVKDEEEMLPCCLAAISTHVDEIVIVDTGSSDATIEIAREYGAKVVEFAWTGSFSDARNESLRHATSDWVLYLDADEHVVEEDGRQLRDLARKTWIEGYHLVETHFTGHDELGSQTVHTPMRLFRRRPQYAWDGAIHEQIMWSMPTFVGERFQQTSVRVDHYGYLASVVDDRDKRERNLSLLLDQVETRRDSFTCFNIASEYGAMQDWATARPWFEEALERAQVEIAWQEQQFAPMLVQRTVTARRTTGAYDEAIALAEQALNWWPAFTDLVFERALVHAARGEWLDAKMQAERALEMGDAPARFVAGSGKGSYQARSLRGAARRQLGDAQGARSDYETAMREAPQYLGATLDLMDVLLELEAPHVADAEIDRLLGDRSSGVAANLLIAAALHEQGAYDLANARYERVLVQQPTHGQALVAQAELRLLERRFAEANELSLLVDPLDRMAPRGARTAFLAAVLLHDSSLYDEPLRRITSSTELPAPERAVYVAWRELLDPTDVVALIPADPIAGLTVLTNLEALAKLQATDEFEQLYTLLAAAIPDERARRWELANLFIRRRFVDMAGEELIACVEQFGPDAQLLAALGKVATMKEMWEDAEVFLSEAIALDPSQDEAHRLLTAIRERQAG